MASKGVGKRRLQAKGPSRIRKGVGKSASRTSKGPQTRLSSEKINRSRKKGVKGVKGSADFKVDKHKHHELNIPDECTEHRHTYTEDAHQGLG